MRNKNLWFICGLALVLSVMFTPKVSATKAPPEGGGKAGDCIENCLLYNQISIECWNGLDICINSYCLTGTCYL